MIILYILLGAILGGLTTGFIWHHVVVRPLAKRYVESRRQICKLQRQIRFLVYRAFPWPPMRTRTDSKAKCVVTDRWN